MKPIQKIPKSKTQLNKNGKLLTQKGIPRKEKLTVRLAVIIS